MKDPCTGTSTVDGVTIYCSGDENHYGPCRFNTQKQPRTLAQLEEIEQRHAQELKAAEARSSDYGVMYAAGEVEALWLDGIPPQEFKGRLESLVVDTQKYLEQREATITKAARVAALKDAIEEIKAELRARDGQQIMVDRIRALIEKEEG